LERQIRHRASSKGAHRFLALIPHPLLAPSTRRQTIEAGEKALASQCNRALSADAKLRNLPGRDQKDDGSCV